MNQIKSSPAKIIGTIFSSLSINKLMTRPTFIGATLVALFLIITCSKTLLGQYTSSPPNTKWESVKTDDKLSNTLFTHLTMFRDSAYLQNGDTDDFNVPIRSNIYAWGACNPDTLLFCDESTNGDTLIIHATAPSMCCMDYLTIRIYKNTFTSYFYYSYDIEPDAVLIRPIVQELTLKSTKYSKGNSLEGYINFIGTGIDTSATNEIMLSHQDSTKDNIQRIDTAMAKGYFKCIIK